MTSKIATVGLGLFLLLFVACDKPVAEPPTAIIIDQLSVSNPNERFAEDATLILEKQGYEVKYVPGEEVTVNFYRDFEGADIIIFRTHMAQAHLREGGEESSFFSSEQFDLYAHVGILLEGHLSEGWMAIDPDRTYFGIMPSFIKHRMDGSEFAGATVIMMGCYGMASEGMADAFFSKGVEHVFGWTGLVGTKHTDNATLSLLTYLGSDDPLALAISKIGPDPEYSSTLEHRKKG